GDDVAEVRSVVRLERAVAVQVLRVDAAVAAGAVRALVADRVRGLVGRRLASLVPEAARVVLPVVPDLVFGEACLLVQDAEAPGPAVRVRARRRAEGVVVERVLADRADVDDERVVRLR